MHERIYPQLAAYHDGELNEAQQRRVQAHLLECPLCRSELAQLQKLDDLLAHQPLPESLRTADLWPGLAGRLSERPAVRAGPGWHWRAWWLAPAGLLLGQATLQAVALLALALSTVMVLTGWQPLAWLSGTWLAARGSTLVQGLPSLPYQPLILQIALPRQGRILQLFSKLPLQILTPLLRIIHALLAHFGIVQL